MAIEWTLPGQALMEQRKTNEERVADPDREANTGTARAGGGGVYEARGPDSRGSDPMRATVEGEWGCDTK